MILALSASSSDGRRVVVVVDVNDDAVEVLADEVVDLLAPGCGLLLKRRK